MPSGEHDVRIGPDVPPGRMLELRGRAPVFVRGAGGPAGRADRHVAARPRRERSAELVRGLRAARRAFSGDRPRSSWARAHAPVSRAFSLGDCADDAFAVADALGLTHFIAVGYSMGGPIAQLMWRRQPARIDGLVLAATSRDFGGRVRERLMFGMLPVLLAASRMPGYRRLRRSALAALTPRFAGPPERAWVVDELARGDSRTIIQATSELGRFTSRDWIGGVDVPTSVVVAMDDQLVPVRRQLKLARSISGAVAAFVNGDHYAAGRADGDFVSVLVHECRAVARRVATSESAAPAYWDELES